MNSNKEKISFEQEAELAFRSAFSELLERKHLYQYTNVDFGKIRSLIPELANRDFHGRFVIGTPSNPPTKKEIEEFIKSLEKQFEDRIGHWSSEEWILIDEATAKAFNGDEERIRLSRFVVPSINTFCSICDSGPWPHNLSHGSGTRGYAFESDDNTANVQIFTLSFQCQHCRTETKEPLVFLVKREGLKLTLVGRSQFPEVVVPNFIPDAQRKFYRNAIIANQTSFTLAAALYLRTVVEQYFYATIPEAEIKAIQGNPTGDELAELYANTLPKNFPSSFPSLKKAYDDLSVIIHSGKENDGVKTSFVAIRNAVDGHFKAVQLFKEMPTQ